MDSEKKRTIYDVLLEPIKLELETLEAMRVAAEENNDIEGCCLVIDKIASIKQRAARDAASLGQMAANLRMASMGGKLQDSAEGRVQVEKE